MRLKRKLRVRAKVFGTSRRPRLAVFRSNRSLSVQIIDDDGRQTLIARRANGKNQVKAHDLGREIAAACAAKKITTVVFDRSGYRYHGVVQALADGAREGGLKF